MNTKEGESQPRRWIKLSRRLHIPLSAIAEVVESEGLYIVCKNGKRYEVPRAKQKHVLFMAKREGLFRKGY